MGLRMRGLLVVQWHGALHPSVPTQKFVVLEIAGFGTPGRCFRGLLVPEVDREECGELQEQDATLLSYRSCLWVVGRQSAAHPTD